MSVRPALYSYYLSSCSFRVRIALAYKGIDYEYRAIDLGGDQHKPHFMSINPKREVPTLVLGNGVTISQSSAIMEYLEEAYPDRPKLLPTDLTKRARVRELCQVVGSGVQPLQNLSVLKRVMSMTDGNIDVKQAVKTKWGYDVVTNGFGALETLMAQSAGRYSVGDEVTMADAFLVPQVFNAARFKVELEEYPVISRVYGTLMELPAVQVSVPDQQPDAISR